LLPADKVLRDCFRRIAEGERAGRQAKDELYRSCRAGLFGLLRVKGFDRETARDLLHDVFERVMRHTELHAVEKPRAWLITVASNLARDRRRRARTTLLDGCQDPGGEDADGVEPRQVTAARDEALWRDIWFDVAQALETLRGRNPRQYLALHCAAQGLSGEELACALEIRRRGTANQYLSDARKALAQIYAEQTGREGVEIGQVLPT
jgi:RNA polymerase sigma factor (sigma-70 family)